MTVDEAGMDTGSERSGLSRRQMIRASAVAGAAAWTAPVILDSLSSPAAAATGGGACSLYVYKVHAQANACSAYAVQTVANCATPLTTSTCTPCSTCKVGTTWTRVVTNDIAQTACTYTNGGALSITVSAPGKTFVGVLARTSCAGGAAIALGAGSGASTQTTGLGTVTNNTDVWLYFLVQ